MRLYRCYVFDLDGTLFRGNEPTPGAVETLAELRRRDAQIRYLTNNSSQTRTFFLDKLRRLGFEAHEDEVYSSALGSASYLRGCGVRSAFVLGEPGLVETLRDAGIEVVNAGDDNVAETEGPPSESVLVGIHRGFTYPLLNAAMQRILSGARFVATNTDTTYPLEGGRLIPGAGSIVAAVQACSLTEPFVVGKPNPFLIELVLHDAGVPPSDALIIGDRLETDIESGRRAGCDTYLVLTGITQQAPQGQPYGQDLRGLL